MLPLEIRGVGVGRERWSGGDRPASRKAPLTPEGRRSQESGQGAVAFPGCQALLGARCLATDFIILLDDENTIFQQTQVPPCLTLEPVRMSDSSFTTMTTHSGQAAHCLNIFSKISDCNSKISLRFSWKCAYLNLQCKRDAPGRILQISRQCS